MTSEYSLPNFTSMNFNTFSFNLHHITQLNEFLHYLLVRQFELEKESSFLVIKQILTNPNIKKQKFE